VGVQIFVKVVGLENEPERDLFAFQEQRTKQTMKIVITLLVGVIAYVLFYLVKNG